MTTHKIPEHLHHLYQGSGWALGTIENDTLTSFTYLRDLVPDFDDEEFSVIDAAQYTVPCPATDVVGMISTYEFTYLTAAKPTPCTMLHAVAILTPQGIDELHLFCDESESDDDWIGTIDELFADQFGADADHDGCVDQERQLRERGERWVETGTYQLNT